jgi:hypothetical protein
MCKEFTTLRVEQMERDIKSLSNNVRYLIALNENLRLQNSNIAYMFEQVCNVVVDKKRASVPESELDVLEIDYVTRSEYELYRLKKINENLNNKFDEIKMSLNDSL